MSHSVRSMESEASNAFKSPTELTAKRLGPRPTSPRPSAPSGGASVGGQSRRSASMIQTAEDEHVFAQISEMTTVTSKKNKQPERARSPFTGLLEDALQGASMDEFMKGANAAAEMLMQSISPTSCGQREGLDDEIQSNECGIASFVSKPSMTSYGNQTVSSAQRTPLDLHHNDDSFHVLANLLIDFLQTKLSPDGTHLVLQPEDQVRMDRVLPEILRLDFIDAVVHRLGKAPQISRSPLEKLIWQCHEFGIDRAGRRNPILAVANLNGKTTQIPVQSFLNGQVNKTSDKDRSKEWGSGDVPTDESSNGRLSRNSTMGSYENQRGQGNGPSDDTSDRKQVPSGQPRDKDEIAGVRRNVSEEISLATTIPDCSTFLAVSTKASSASEKGEMKSSDGAQSVPVNSELPPQVLEKGPKSLERIASYVLKQDGPIDSVISGPNRSSVFGFQIPTTTQGSISMQADEERQKVENLSPKSTGGFLSSLNPFNAFSFAGNCVPDPPFDMDELQRQKQLLSSSVQRTFSESVATSPANTFQQDRELTFDETKALAKEQLNAEIREAQILISQSKSPETIAFWEEHVAELKERICAIDRPDEDHESITTVEQSSVEMKGPSKESIMGSSSLLERIQTFTAKESMKSALEKTDIKDLQAAVTRESKAPNGEHLLSSMFSPSVKPASSPKSPSRDSMQWNEGPSYDEPMVDVVAPADLPGGYHFEAELEGRRFLATVPAGGVKQGETFTCYMRALDSVAIDIPVGYWKDNMTDVCAYGCCHPVFWNPIICPLTSLWQIQTRVGLDFMGRPLEEGSPPPPIPNRTTLLTVLISWILMNGALIAGYDFKFSRGLNLTFADISAFGVVNLSMFTFLVFITQSTRSSIRDKFLIREHRCSDLEDIYVSTCAMPCTIAQMSRHTANYDDYEAVCCSKTGLPDGVRVNQMYAGSNHQGSGTKSPSGYTAPAIV